MDVQRQGRKVQAAHFLLLLLPPSAGGANMKASRVGVTVSSKVGNAVVRNRLKRWVREFVRQHQPALPRTDVVFIAKMSAAQIVHPDADRDLARLLLRAGDVTS